MCTRYYMEMSPELRPIVEEARRSSLASRMTAHFGRTLKTEGEIRPTDIAPVIAPNKHGIRSVYPMIWGFGFRNPSDNSSSSSSGPGRKQPIVNCRIETAPDKPMWAESWSRRRCIIPASWYFEWEHLIQPDGKKKTGAKYLLHPEQAGKTGTEYMNDPGKADLCCLAGLYRIENGYPHFAILTRNSAPEIRFIHDRMPVILDAEVIDTWIDPGASPEIINQIAGSAFHHMSFEKV